MRRNTLSTALHGVVERLLCLERVIGRVSYFKAQIGSYGLGNESERTSRFALLHSLNECAHILRTAMHVLVSEAQSHMKIMGIKTKRASIFLRLRGFDHGEPGR